MVQIRLPKQVELSSFSLSDVYGARILDFKEKINFNCDKTIRIGFINITEEEAAKIVIKMKQKSPQFGPLNFSGSIEFIQDEFYIKLNDVILINQAWESGKSNYPNPYGDGFFRFDFRSTNGEINYLTAFGKANIREFKMSQILE